MTRRICRIVAGGAEKRLSALRARWMCTSGQSDLSFPNRLKTNRTFEEFQISVLIAVQRIAHSRLGRIARLFARKLPDTLSYHGAFCRKSFVLFLLVFFLSAVSIQFRHLATKFSSEINGDGCAQACRAAATIPDNS